MTELRWPITAQPDGPRPAPAPALAPAEAALGPPRRAAGGPADPRLQRGVAEIHAMVASRLEDGAPPETILPLIRDAARVWAERLVRAGAPVPSPADREALAQAVYDQRYGLGPLASYLRDPAVENIDINGCDQVWVTYSTGERVMAPPVAASDEALIDMIRNWAARGGQTARDFSAGAPLVNVALTGGARMTATMAVTPRPCVSLRRHGHLDMNLAKLGSARHCRSGGSRVPGRGGQEPLQHRHHRRRERGKDHAAARPGGRDPARRAGRHPGVRVRAFPAPDMPGHPDVIAFEAREPNGGRRRQVPCTT